MTNNKPVYGTKEWSVASVNCVNGCSHDCRYCYARHNAVRRFRRMSADDWPVMKVRDHDVRRNWPKHDGTVMFPTTHDITPDVLDACLTVLTNLIAVGNRVLIVSKPHLDCISAICSSFASTKQQLLFRFTIGADDDDILRYWEPGAPGFEERLMALEYAYEEGFETSVSVEPMLDARNIQQLVRAVHPFVTDAIWIGKVNALSTRVAIETEVDDMQVELVRGGQSDKAIIAIYECLRKDTKVKWKESIKRVVGLDVSTNVGEDA